MSDRGFGERLRRILAEQGISTRELALKVGKSQAAVSKWLRGGNIEYATLRELARCLQVDWLWLGFGEQCGEGAERRDRTPFGNARRQYVAELMEQANRATMIQRLAGVIMWEFIPLTGALVISDIRHPQAYGPICYLEQLIASMPAGEAAELMVQVQRILATPDLVRLVFDQRMTMADGYVRWFRICAGVERDALHRPLRVVGTCIGITDLKPAPSM